MSSTTTQQSTICQHCSNSYQDPRILSCLHSYCLQCITRIHSRGTTPITCPSCNHPTPMPNGGVASLPRNIQLKQEAQQDNILQRVVSSLPPICDNCEEDGSVSVAYCTDCDHLLCKTCWGSHQKMKALRSHATFARDDLKKKNRGDLLKLLTPPNFAIPSCPDHDDQKLGYYCTQCAVPVCVACTLVKHKGHQVQEVNKQVIDSKKKILQDIVPVQGGKKKLEQAIKSIQETMKKVKNHKSQVDSVIREAFAKLRQVIDQREKALLAESSQITVAKGTRLSIQLEGIQRLLESVNQCHSLASVAAGQYGDIQLLYIANTLHNRAISLQRQLTEVKLDSCEAHDMPVDVDTEPLIDMIAKFGSVTEKPLSFNCGTAVLPFQRLGVGAEMKVEVILADGTGKESDKGGSGVKGRLTCGGKGSVLCPAIDNGDGTYIVSITPEQVGRNQLSITVNDQSIQGSPFSLNVVPRCDYTRLKDPVQTITGINRPICIAFTDDGDMFVTSRSDCCIHVYDSRGKQKTTIGSKGSGKLQFKTPYGITICGEVVYVAEYNGHRIHKLTTGGEFLDTVGERGHNTQQFNGPLDVKIRPDRKIHVADTNNNRVQVFNSNWTISHVISGKRSAGDGSFPCPFAIAFDLSGDVHVAGLYSNSVKVFTQCGQFVRQYGTANTDSPSSVAIDPSGYSLVTYYNKGCLSVLDPRGRLIHSVGGFNCPRGVSVSPDGSVWVADTENDRLVKY